MILTESEIKWIKELNKAYNNNESHIIYLLYGQKNELKHRMSGKTTALKVFSELSGIEIYNKNDSIEKFRGKRIDYVLVDENVSIDKIKDIINIGIKVLGFCSI